MATMLMPIALVGGGLARLLISRMDLGLVRGLLGADAALRRMRNRPRAHRQGCERTQEQEEETMH